MKEATDSGYYKSLPNTNLAADTGYGTENRRENGQRRPYESPVNSQGSNEMHRKLGALSSLNFSSDSLPDNSTQGVYSTVPKVNLPTSSVHLGSPTPNLSTFARNGAPSPSSIISNSNFAKARPTSFIGQDYMNYTISEDETINPPHWLDIQQNTHSMHGGSIRNHLPPPTPAPPLGPISTGSSRSSSPVRSASPSRYARSHIRSKSPVRRGSSPSKSQPFNFNSQDMINMAGSNQMSKMTTQRRGHKYKHSSVSMNMFQDPIFPINNEKTLALPDSFPIPNIRELAQGMNNQQKKKIVCCVLHAVFSLVIFSLGFKLHISSLSTLAHLVFFNALGSMVVVFAGIMSNYEIWSNSSLSYPFGIGRLEVLIAFALNASLIMLGADLISHSIEEYVVSSMSASQGNSGSSNEHPSLEHHGHTLVVGNFYVYELTIFITILVTLASSKFISGIEQKTGSLTPYEKMNFRPKEEALKSSILLPNEKPESSVKTYADSITALAYFMATNPTHLLTLSYCVFLGVVPFIQNFLLQSISIGLDDISALFVAFSLCYLGYKVVVSQGGILLLSYPSSTYDYNVLRSVIYDQIISLHKFKPSYSIEKLFLTKFNFDLVVVGIKINSVGIDSDDHSALRFEIDRIIRKVTKNHNMYCSGDKIEITIDICS